MSPIPLYLITGFLGSGKTTLLNNLLEGLGGRRAGVIVNEFGPVNIDALRLAASGARPGEIVELNNGQIFCSCLAGSFVESVLALAGMQIDLILVECSGLSRPAPLDAMMCDIEKRTGGRVAYRGMVCVADAESYPALSQAAAAVTEQVIRSGVILVNKIDRVPPDEGKQVMRDLAALNPRARIIPTSYCKTDRDLLALASTGADERPGDQPAACASAGSSARPQSVFLPADGTLDEESVRAFLGTITGMTYRVKGLLHTRAGDRSIDCVGDTVAIDPWRDGIVEPGLVVVLRHGASPGEIPGAWEKLINGDGRRQVQQ